MIKNLRILTLSVAILLPAVARCDELQGAEVILKKLSEFKATPPEKKEPTAAEVLIEKIEKFKTEARTLAPEAAAKKWLELNDTLTALSSQELSDCR